MSEEMKAEGLRDEGREPEAENRDSRERQAGIFDGRW